jgi:hypothetical protein
MVHFQVDPDSLTAAAEVARRQHDHVGAVSDYIDSACSRFDAFSGVLNLFEGNYRDTVHNAQQGMRSSQKVADTVAEMLAACRHDYLESDRSSHRTFVQLFGDEMALPPYVAPGSGDSTPGGPASPAGTVPPGEDGEPFGLQKLPAWMSEPFNRVAPGDPNTLAPGLSPRTYAKDKVLEHVRDAQTRHDYLAYRSQGMTPAEALSHAQRDVDSVADGHVYDSLQDRQAGAYTRAYDDAIADGRSRAEATQAGQDAANDQRQSDSTDYHHRQDVLSTAGTYKGAYDQVTDVVAGVNDVVEGAEQLHETGEDLDEYDDYEDRPEDRSAQSWARP